HCWPAPPTVSPSCTECVTVTRANRDIAGGPDDGVRTGHPAVGPGVTRDPESPARTARRGAGAAVAADGGGRVRPDTTPRHRRLQRTSSGRILTESTFGNGPTPDGVVCAGTPPTRRPHRPRSVPGPRLVRGCRGDASGHHRLSARVLVPSGNVSLGRDPGAPHLEALAATNAASRFSRSEEHTSELQSR